ncbi:hypothetical protein ABK040_010886 [Willaertia magna]
MNQFSLSLLLVWLLVVLIIGGMKEVNTLGSKIVLHNDDTNFLFEQVSPEIWSINNAFTCWNTLPFQDEILQVKSLGINSHGVGLLVLTSNDLYLAIVPSKKALSSDVTKWINLSSELFRSFIPNFDRLTKLRTNNNGFIIVSNSYFIYCKNQDWNNIDNWSCPIVNNIFQSLSTINDIVVTDWNNLQLLVGTNSGLFITHNYLQQIELVKDIGTVPVMAVSYNTKTTDIAASTQTKLFIYSTIHQRRVWYAFANSGLIDGPYANSLAFDEITNILWVSNTATMISINFNNHFELIRFGSGLDSIPYNTSQLVVVDNISKNQLQTSIWFGTKKGAVRYKKSLHKEEWSYFYGSRYLPEIFTIVNKTVADNGDQEIIDLCVNHCYNYEMTVVATKHGLSILHFPIISYDTKEQHYNNIVFPRHWRSGGLVTQISLSKFGDLNSWNKWNDTTDNDALWSSYFVVYKSLQYQITNNSNDKQIGWKAYEAIEFLLNVTCVTGYTARTINLNYPLHGGKWFKSTCTSDNWYFKSDASSDTVSGQIVSHVFAYYLLADNHNEKTRVKRNLYNILHYIVKNGFLLYDVDGERTKWGVWAPQFLNNNPNFYGERGVNSLEIVSWLLATYSITGDDEFKDAFLYLIDEHFYDINIVNQKLKKPAEVNYSDDQLSFLPYFIYFFTFSQLTEEQHSARKLYERILPVIKISFERAYDYIKKERSIVWNVIYGLYKEKILQQREDNVDWVNPTLQSLQEWPLSLVDWPYYANHRTDIQIDPYKSRGNTLQSLNLIPYSENTFLRWNGNPFELDEKGSGYSEDVPSYWLLSYWTLKYLGKLQ